MTQKPYLLFHQTAEQLRRVAARGGRATARNRRVRLRTAAPPPRRPRFPRRHTPRPPPPPSPPWRPSFPGCPKSACGPPKGMKTAESRRHPMDAPLVEVDRAVEQSRPSGCLIRSVYLNQ